jgi:small subunit ribosomal protein S3
MGQKANINSLHLGRNKDWNCVWYTNNSEYSKVLTQDLIILNYLKSCYIISKNSEVVKIRICRISKNIIINLQLTNDLKSDSLALLKMLVFNLKNVFSNFDRIFIVSKILSSNELRTDPIFLSKKIAILIENRIRFRSHLIKNLMSHTAEMCIGIKVLCKGRLNGADMADSDSLTVGSIPFQTLKAKINYGFSVANTAKGLQSIKVWIYNR